jgi:RNA polymerase sigma factor (TIGR02999 family)
MSSKGAPQSVTVLLEQWRAGDAKAMESLIPIIYSQLRYIAAQYLRAERAGHTLQPTALVNEAYLRLVEQDQVSATGRTHFMAIAANVMRQVLVDHARARKAAKRDGGQRIELTESDHPAQSTNADLVAVHDALERLAEFDPRLGRLVELRFFGGLSIEETAMALDLSAATVKRDWTLAKAWLSCELRGTH